MDVLNMKYLVYNRGLIDGEPYSHEPFKITDLNFIPNNIIILPITVATQYSSTSYGAGFLDLQMNNIISYPFTQKCRSFIKDSSGENFTFSTSASFIADITKEENNTYTLVITPKSPKSSYNRIMKGEYWIMVYKTL